MFCILQSKNCHCYLHRPLDRSLYLLPKFSDSMGSWLLESVRLLYFILCGRIDIILSQNRGPNRGLPTSCFGRLGAPSLFCSGCIDFCPQAFRVVRARVKGTIHIRWLISSSLSLPLLLWLTCLGTLTVQLLLNWEGGSLPHLEELSTQHMEFP